MTRGDIPIGSAYALQPGAAAQSSSAPVVLANENVLDYMLAGGATRSALNDNLLGASGSTATDTLVLGSGYGSARSLYVQIIGSSGISAGQVIYEGSHDNVTFTALPWFDQVQSVPQAITSAFSIAASGNRFFGAPVTYRYVRVRISTAFTGGTVSAIVKFSPEPFPMQVVAQGVAANLKTAATPTPATSGGNTMYTGSLTNTATSIKASAGQVYGWDFHNPNASIVYVQFFNVLVGSVTVGTTAPVYSVGLPANAKGTAQWPHGIAHSTAIVVAVTTTRAGSTAPGSSVDLNVLYT